MNEWIHYIALSYGKWHQNTVNAKTFSYIRHYIPLHLTLHKYTLYNTTKDWTETNQFLCCCTDWKGLSCCASKHRDQHRWTLIGQFFAKHLKIILTPSHSTFFHAPHELKETYKPNSLTSVGCGGSVVGSVPCIQKVAGSNPTLAAM